MQLFAIDYLPHNNGVQLFTTNKSCRLKNKKKLNETIKRVRLKYFCFYSKEKSFWSNYYKII